MGSLKYLKQAYPSVEKVAIVMPDDDTITFLQPLYQMASAAEGLTLIGEPILYPNEMQDFSPIVAKINTLEEAEAICHTNGVSQQNGAKPQ